MEFDRCSPVGTADPSNRFQSSLPEFFRFRLVPRTLVLGLEFVHFGEGKRGQTGLIWPLFSIGHCLIALYQGTTLVVPQVIGKTLGFRLRKNAITEEHHANQPQTGAPCWAPRAHTWAENDIFPMFLLRLSRWLWKGEHLLGLRPFIFGPCMGPRGPTWGTPLWLGCMVPFG